MTELHVALTDAPYSTIQAAYDALVAQKTNGTLTMPAVINVHGGVYRIAKPLLFQEDLPVVIKAFDDEEVIIDGGLEITGWKQTVLNGKKVFRADLPKGLDPVEINQLYVNGVLRSPSCVPKAPDFFRVTDDFPCGFHPTPETDALFHYDGNDFDPSWYDPQNILMIMPHLWAEERARIESFDTETKTIVLQSSFCHQPLKSRSEYRFYNVREGLTDPGEYYIDRHEKAIYYIPVKGETLKNISAVIPATGTLAEITGAQWLTLDGLTFRHGGGFYPYTTKYFDLRDGSEKRNSMISPPMAKRLANAKKPQLQGTQASLQVPGLILFSDSQNCVMRRCTVTDSGWYGIAIACGCKNITVEENELYNLGGGGIRISGGRWEEVVEQNHPEMATSHAVIRKNHIHDCCKLFFSAVGIILSDARSCLIEENHIHDMLYSGISCGWTWGFRPQVTAENRIIGNHIHHLGKGITSDMGGVYLLGVQPGTRVADNVIHDIESRYYGGWGLYTDEGSSNIVLEHNLVYNCSCEAYHQHYGRENIVRENVFAFGKDAVIAVTNLRQDGYASPGQHYGKAISFYKNLLITNGSPFYRAGASEVLLQNKIDSESNIFCNMSDADTIFGKYTTVIDNERKTILLSLKEWQKMGYDLTGKMVDDPGFTNPEKGDFSLKKSSWLKKHPFFQWLVKKK